MARFIKVGSVMTKKAPKTGVHIGTGDKFRKLNVNVTVTDESGNTVAQATNPFLHVQDPRKRPGATEEEVAKIPTWLKQELFLVVD